MRYSVKSDVHTITQEGIAQERVENKVQIKAYQTLLTALAFTFLYFHLVPSAEANTRFDNFTNDIYDYGTLDIEQSGFHYGLKSNINRQQFEIFRAAHDWIDQPNDFYVNREVIISAQTLFSYLKPLIGQGQLPLDSGHQYLNAAQKTAVGYSLDLMPSGMLMSMSWHF